MSENLAWLMVSWQCVVIQGLMTLMQKKKGETGERFLFSKVVMNCDNTASIVTRRTGDVTELISNSGKHVSQCFIHVFMADDNETQLQDGLGIECILKHSNYIVT